MLDKLPTAEEFFQQEMPHRYIYGIVRDEIQQAMIEFAKLHVQEALTQASEKAEIIYEKDVDWIYKDSIISNMIKRKIK